MWGPALKPLKKTPQARLAGVPSATRSDRFLPRIRCSQAALVEAASSARRGLSWACGRTYVFCAGSSSTNCKLIGRATTMPQGDISSSSHPLRGGSLRGPKRALVSNPSYVRLSTKSYESPGDAFRGDSVRGCGTGPVMPSAPWWVASLYPEWSLI